MPTSAPATSPLTELVATIPLIDHHCHGITGHDLDDREFAALFSESYRPPPEGTSEFQKPLGLAIRRFCAPVLDLEPGVPGARYAERRRELGAAEVNRRLLRGTGIGRLLIDTGHRAEMILGVPQMAEIAGCPAFEIVRIEAVAEAVARSGVAAADFADAFAARLREISAEAVGLKTIVAYRITFAFDHSAPAPAEVARAAGAWFAAAQATGRWRLADPVVLRHILWVAADLCRERGWPLQVHVGIGDADILMHACDPTHFTPFIAALDAWDVPVMLLHNYPFIREAQWMSEVFRNVYYDIGVVQNYAAGNYRGILAQALEMGKFTKFLFSSDAFGLAELFYLAAFFFRRSLARQLQGWIDDGLCSEADAEEILRLFAEGNARRIYRGIG
jgi:predicted TIM-barrel fold metal-dependent hydrolase